MALLVGIMGNEGRQSTGMRLVSWNVNGIRAVHNKGIFLDWLNRTRPDIVGLQETKASPDQLDSSLLAPDGYQTFWSSATRKGYSGVALFTRVAPRSVTLGMGIPEYDDEGRTIIAEYDDFVFITAYFPNGGRDHLRVPFKMAYKDAFRRMINGYRAAGKSVIFCGDVNTSHQPIDLARPKQNEKTTGFLPEERVWLDQILGEDGYIDTFRYKYPTTQKYSWWSAVTDARARNIGWRLDYFIISPDLLPRLEEAEICDDVYGSDHCPVALTLSDR
jgi:exodeoxyribonuclease-3